MGLLDDSQFSELWAKHSGLPVRFISPLEIQTPALQRLAEKQSIEFGALPVAEKPDELVMAFLEPPSRARLVELNRQTGATVIPRARPSLESRLRPRPSLSWSGDALAACGRALAAVL
jgi:hypothetical protein